MKNHRLSQIAGAVVVALGLSTSAMANETASGITGQVLTPAGEAAANTKVIVTHIPTGAVKVVETNATGNFSLRGLRVGGPYKVVFDSDVYKDQQFDDVYLQVGKPQRLSASLEREEMEVISVTASRVVGYTNSGSAGAWGSEDIINAAGGNRDLKDVLRSNPLVTVSTDDEGSMSIAGSNPRFNSFTVDGVRQNDDFGLNGNGYPTQRSPISIDAVEQVSVETIPFSVKNGGFSGGQINAVTKSGTNEFSGSLSYEREDDSWAGDPKNLDGEEVEQEFESDTWSATLGGPIIKDKLFFFASYEKFEQPTIVDFVPAGVSGSANTTNATLEDYEQIKQIGSTVYGVDIGNWDTKPVMDDEKLLLKLDWNINDDHRASFTYQDTEGNSYRNLSSSSSELRLDTHWYNKNEKLTTFSGHLYSNWTADFSTEIKVAYKEVETSQAPKNKEIGDVTVTTENGRVAFGADQYRHGNELSNETLSLRFLGEYLYNDHEITFGMEYESIDVMNLFAPNSLGRWEFDSIEDFANQEASGLTYANAYTNDIDDARATFKFETTTLFIEDTYYVHDDVRVTAGVRYEMISSGDEPTNNANFEQRYGFSNSVSLDGESIILPRVSFEWDAADDLVVRGGVGRFSGGRPNVWLSNAYSNDGVTYVSAYNESDYLSGADITQVPQGVLDSMVSGDGNVNVTDPNFELPSDWRASVGFDYNFEVEGFGDSWLWTAEFIHTKKENDPFWVDLSRVKVGETAAGQPIYQPIDNLTGEETSRYDLMLTNADDDGRSNILSTSLSAAFENGLSFNASYTHMDVTEGTPGTSSTATSNFQYPVTTDRGAANVGTATYEVEHAFKLNLDYAVSFFEDYETRFNLYYERRSGRPVSWVLGSYRDDDFGDQSSFSSSSAYLPYIPTDANDPNVVYGYGLDYATLKERIDALGLSGYEGGFLEKGATRAPWVTRLDLNITQQVPGFIEGHKGEVFFSIRNLLNLIDSSKGQALRNQFGTQSLVDLGGIDDQGRYIYDDVFGGYDGNTYDTFDAKNSAWSLKVGVRYRF